MYFNNGCWYLHGLSRYVHSLGSTFWMIWFALQLQLDIIESAWHFVEIAKNCAAAKI